MKWIRIGDTSQLKWQNRTAFPVPPAYWGQVDVWLPAPLGNSSCAPITNQFTPYFMYVSGVQDGFAAIPDIYNPPYNVWDRWTSFSRNALGPLLTPATTYTIGFHVISDTSVDWYVNGVFVLNSPTTFAGALNQIILNYTFAQCCCQAVFYTNFKVGTAQGASDIFADDFSGGINPLDWSIADNYGSFHPALVSVVDAPYSFPCPVVEITPERAMPGDTITAHGTGFTPGSPITLYWQGNNAGGGVAPVEEFSATADGTGQWSATFKVPHGLGTNADPFYPHTGNPSHDVLYFIDAQQLVGCDTTFSICGGRKSDGIVAQWNNDQDQNPTDTPNPVVAIAGTTGTTFSEHNAILDYIFHDGAHWVLWQDNSQITAGGHFNPIPTNHTMNATRISVDGSSIVDYPIDSDYAFSFDTSGYGDPGLFESQDCEGTPVGCPVWDLYWFFTGWSKPIDDVRFCSDGVNLWVGLVSQHTVPYPYLDNQSATTNFPGDAEQFVPMSVLTSGFTSFATDAGSGYHRYHRETFGPLGFYDPNAFPVGDAGDHGSGFWTIPYIAVYHFNGSGFDEIGRTDAIYCPGETTGRGWATSALLDGPSFRQVSPRGGLFSRIAIAASKDNPGVCHVVWSEGGDWGRCGLGGAGGVPCAMLTWDGGPQNRSYRTIYQQYSPTAKVSEQTLWESHIDRTQWWFPFDWGDPDNPFDVQTGYTWPPLEEFAGLLTFDVRCDNANGDVLLFVGQNQPIQNTNTDWRGQPFLDWLLLFCDTLRIYDITSGTPILRQTLAPELMPNLAEAQAAYPPATHSDVRAPDCMVAVPYHIDNFGGVAISYGPQDRGFAISDIYEDPLLDGTPVYLVSVLWGDRYTNFIVNPYGSVGPTNILRAWYRVPADMSDTFDWLDGERAFGFTVVGDVFGVLSVSNFGNGDFFSDERNIWIPWTYGQNARGNGRYGQWFDRVCQNRWQQLNGAFTPSYFTTATHAQVGYAACPGFHYDPAGDTLSLVSMLAAPYTPPTALFAVTTLHICRGCRVCGCGLSINIAHRA